MPPSAAANRVLPTWIRLDQPVVDMVRVRERFIIWFSDLINLVPDEDFIEARSRPDEGLSEKMIDECLKTMICLYSDSKEDPKVCVVCQENLFEEKETIGILECGHEFHASCIKQWLRQKNVCPLCKAVAV